MASGDDVERQNFRWTSVLWRFEPLSHPWHPEILFARGVRSTRSARCSIADLAGLLRSRRSVLETPVDPG